jgi:RND family efflux transporter MFP subunit
MADQRLIRVLHHLRRTIARSGGLSDAHLLERFVTTGDEAAFELLVRRHERLVFGVCRRNLRDYHDAEDAFQATFLALARKASSISRRQALAGWLYQVAYRLAVRLGARRSRDWSRVRGLDTAEMIAAPAELKLPAELNEVRAILDEEVNRLPERFRLAIVVCYLEGKTVAEAAAQLGWPRGTVASRLARARERLRKRLVRRGLALPDAGVAAALSFGNVGAAPAAWMAAAVRASHLVGGDKLAAAAGVSARVVTLTQEVLRAMFVKKAIVGGTVLLASVLFLGGGLGLHLTGGTRNETAPMAAAGEPKPGADGPKRGPQAKSPDKRAPKIGRPVERDVAPYEDFTGRLEAASTTQVLARVGGRLEKVHCKAGVSVKKGDLLFEIDATALVDALERAEGKLRLVQIMLKKNEAHLKSVRELHVKNFVSKEELDKALYQTQIDGIEVNLCVLDRARARRELAAAKITSPAAGRVGQSLANAGTFVVADKTILASVTVLDPMHVVFDMDERSFLRYQELRRKEEIKAEGSRLAVGLAGDKGFPHQATLASFDDRFNPGTGTIRVRGTLPNPRQQLLPGMFARIHMPFGKPRRMLVVPDAALSSGSGGIRIVVVINKGNQPELHEVKTGQLDGDMRVIESGLRADELVVLDAAEARRLLEAHDRRRVNPDQKMP